MAFDGITTRAVVNELNKKIKGLRVDKIYQVEKDEILLYFRKYKLLLSSSGNTPRIYLTEITKDNPQTPPIFTMVLRKHLLGAIVKEVVQYGNDRVVEIKFDAWDEFSDKTEKSLLVEIMGRHSNIILMDKDKVIIDAIKRVNYSMSRVREILPHLPYTYLGDTNKFDPLTINKEDFYRILEGSPINKSLENTIFHNFTGFSKSIGSEVSTRAGLDPQRPLSSLDDSEKNRLEENFFNLMEEVKNYDFDNRIYFDSEKVIDFHVIRLESLAGLENKSFQSPSELLDSLYTKRDNDDRMGQKSQALKKSVNSKLQKDKQKLSNLEKDLLEAENREIYRVYADLLSANFHRIQPGQREIELENFYTEDMNIIRVPLDEKISGPQNAQKYYKKYGKLKNAEQVLSTQISETKSEIDYLDSVIAQIDLANSIDELEETKEELIDQGYIKRSQKKKKKSQKENEVNFKEYVVDGFSIYVGKNNKENDLLTHRFARKDDLWFHAQGIPGSHVVVKTDGKEVSDKVINFAGKLAAYNSKYRESGPIDIDYTKKQNVKRHPANKPGLVNYTDFSTILVDSKKPTLD